MIDQTEYLSKIFPLFKWELDIDTVYIGTYKKHLKVGATEWDLTYTMYADFFDRAYLGSLELYLESPYGELHLIPPVYGDTVTIVINNFKEACDQVSLKV
jgi:hypothetical protein